MKKFLAVLLAATLSLSLIACGNEDTDDNTNSNIEETSQEESDVQTNDDSTNLDSEENVAIELIAGEQGQYGSLITMSKGTDMEESFYVYYVPAGTYEVTNKGDYMTQVSVYEGFAKNEETGYDEYTNMGEIVMLDVGKTDTIEVPDGWFIEIQEPTHISMTLTE